MLFAINIYQFVYQYFIQKNVQNHTDGLYSQLWDIIVEIDGGNIKDLQEIKKLINQVRIQSIAISHTLKSKEKKEKTAAKHNIISMAA